MNAAPPTTADPHAWHHAMLHDLADLSMELARSVQRQTIALDARLAAAGQAAAAGMATERARRAAADHQRKHRARAEIRRRVADAADADPTPQDTEALLRDLDDRLHDDDIDAALSVDSLTDIVLALCAEFGLKPDLAQRTDAELALHGAPAWHAPSPRRSPPPLPP